MTGHEIGFWRHGIHKKKVDQHTYQTWRKAQDKADRNDTIKAVAKFVLILCFFGMAAFGAGYLATYSSVGHARSR